MMVLSCTSISKSFGADVVLKNVTFLLQAGEKAAVVGANGAGKTTLFKILCGNLTADGGNVVLAKTTELGYMAQIPIFDSERTIYAELKQVFEPVLEIERTLRDMERRMALVSGDELKDLMLSYERGAFEFERARGYEYESRIRGVLRGLGFSENDYNRKHSELSGGQKTRLALAKLLLSEPGTLLLDEPTNHLDLESIEWLEGFLADYPGSVIIISHDRYFLDKIVTKVIEIENGESTVYNGNYSDYAQRKLLDREIALKHYLSQQKEIKRQEAVITKLRSYNREKSIKRAESREKLLNKIERIERPLENSKMRMSLLPVSRSGNDVLTVKALSKSYGRHEVFNNVNFEIKRTEKVALIGPNGVGKTTLFRMLRYETAVDNGVINFGANVSIGYYDQEHENLDITKTIFQELADSYPRLEASKLRNALAAFMFTGDDIYKRISLLSGGERGRVALAKIMLSNANFLILDEPTNHLDIYSREVLEDAIVEYGGTVLYVSHDRYFISRTADKIIELSRDGAITYGGGYDFYLEKKNLEKKNLEKKKAEPIQALEKPKRERVLSERRLRAQVQKLETAIEHAEAELRRIDEELHNETGSDFAHAEALYTEKLDIESTLEQLYNDWENLCS